MLKKEWPTDYPAHIIVPPEHASHQQVDLYRIVGANPPTQNDFLASYKDPEQAHLVKYPKFANNPNFYGTSLFSKHRAIVNVMEANPNKFRNKKIAHGTVLVEHGMVGVESGSSHVTTWFFDGAFPVGFKVI
ncbi:hypothetical protein ACRN9F_09305 [Shewanella oncorhynchi]|uniref:hypothetical protein n=1 Tax=Shewanella oncorhynchi TaxID=2726434 RepID=UPI003D7BD64B